MWGPGALGPREHLRWETGDRSQAWSRGWGPTDLVTAQEAAAGRGGLPVCVHQTAQPQPFCQLCPAALGSWPI